MRDPEDAPESAEPITGEVIRCDACPVLCRIRKGQSGACDRYANEDGKLVRLEYDGERKDPYDRTLAYVYLDDGTLANEAIIRAGLAETYRRFTYRLKPQFQAAEKEARDAHRGMWATRRP